MIQTFQSGKPKGVSQSVTLNNAVHKLDSAGVSFAVVQIQDNAGNYALIQGQCARYERDGTSPTHDAGGGGKGFIAGNQDTIVFSNAELIQGVEFINYTTGQAVDIKIQYYEM